ncbi:hypothetical protein CAEBREN_09184 [Caenorhabditis brenneri]|uniref:Uncharacterized protein n=1 Tax=Caenorhabditis brenneri TaxID=135651 RepID=G0MDU1_CAEBE|nr:hypothetical protein CAEBREN_09184 [Caenorhabditis brenneri]
MLGEELSAKTLGYANWNWILSVFTFDIITSAARLLIYVLEYNIYRGSWAKLSEVDSYLGTYCLWLIVFNEFHIATALVFCLSSRSYTKLLIAYVSFSLGKIAYLHLIQIACSGAAVFCHVNPYVIELLRLAEYIYIVNVWTLTIHFVFIPITTIKCGLIIWVLWRTSKACPYYEEDEEGRLGIRNGVRFVWLFFLLLIVSWELYSQKLKIESIEFFSELCIVQYVCASIFLVCGMFLTVILWKIRVVKPKIVKRKKKKPRKIKYKVIYGGEESGSVREWRAQ